VSALSVPSPRRYYLLKRMEARRSGDQPMDGVWRHKQESQPGTDLPTTFPFRALLLAAGYATDEDLVGASAEELAEHVPLNPRDAATVVAAAAAL
jgi:hypothetical protein